MNDFEADDAFQRRMRDTWLLPWYRGFATYKLVDRDSQFQRRGIDTVLDYADGRALTVEEKIVRWKGREYDAFALETDSCTVAGHESSGWMHYSEADRLLYCFAKELGGLRGFWIDMQPLKEWFWKRPTEFPESVMATKNRTRVRVVPIRLVEAAIRTKYFEVG